MVGRMHRALANKLVSLGRSLGFFALMELRVGGLGDYHPVHDVVWLANITNNIKYIKNILKEYLYINGKYYIPIIIFEITGVDATTKTVLAELEVSRRIGSPLTIVVSPDAPFDRQSRKTGMNVNRIIKIIKSYSMLRPGALVGAMSHSDVIQAECACQDSVFEFEVLEERVIERWPGLTRKPRPDATVSIKLPDCVLKCLSENISFIPNIRTIDILGIEIERRTRLKHLAGSIFLLESFYPRGLLLVPKERVREAEKLVNALGARGRVFVRSLEEAFA